MPSAHDHLVGQVCPGDLGNDIIVSQVLIREFNFDLHFHLNRNVFFQDAHDPVILFCGHGKFCGWGGSTFHPWVSAHLVHHDRTKILPAAGCDNGCGSFGEDKINDLLPGQPFPARFPVTSSPWTLSGWNTGPFVKLFIGICDGNGIEMWGYFLFGLHEHNDIL